MSALGEHTYLKTSLRESTIRPTTKQSNNTDHTCRGPCTSSYPSPPAGPKGPAWTALDTLPMCPRASSFVVPYCCTSEMNVAAVQAPWIAPQPKLTESGCTQVFTRKNSAMNSHFPKLTFGPIFAHFRKNAEVAWVFLEKRSTAWYHFLPQGKRRVGWSLRCAKIKADDPHSNFIYFSVDNYKD